MLHVDPENPTSPVATDLLTRLARDVADRYSAAIAEGRGLFKPDDVRVPRSIFVVAWFGSDAVGCGALVPVASEPDTGEIKRVYIDPPARRKGIGREILQDLEAHARGFGYTRLVLETGVRQPEAIALCEKAGFVALPPSTPPATSPGSLRFAKNLAPSLRRRLDPLSVKP